MTEDNKNIKKNKIAFINQRYGVGVLGGSETYTRKMAEALAKKDGFEVEVLTSKALDFVTWEDHFEKDVEEINGVTVRRFGVAKKRNRVVQRSSQVMMHNLGIHTKNLEEKRLIARGPFVPGLVDYIKEHKDEYDAFIFVTYMYYPAYFGAKEVYDKAIFVPTAHDEEPIYMDIFNDLFNKVRGIVYLTDEEKKFVNGHFRNENVSSAVIGMGIEIPEKDGLFDTENSESESNSNQDKTLTEFAKKNNLPDEYIIYCGRIEENKGVKMLIEFLQRFNKENEQKMGLVLTGKGNLSIPEDENIKYLGFVSEEDKFAAINGAKIFCLPSEFESFSIALLEGMGSGKPALVNKKCEVLNGHIIRSGGGFAFENYDEFKASLIKLQDEATNKELGQKAAAYVSENYSTEAVTERFANFVNSCVTP